MTRQRSNVVVLNCFEAPCFRFIMVRSGILGRSSSCDFVVHDSSVSRKHAQLRLSGSGLAVTDLGSSNGTFVGDSRVRASQVSPGQVVRFGGVCFIVTLEDLEETQRLAEEETDKRDYPSGGRGAPSLAMQEALSTAQRRVFDLLLLGHPEKAIAQRLNLSHHTVHNHVRAIFRTFGVHSRTELLGRMIRG